MEKLYGTNGDGACSSRAWHEAVVGKESFLTIIKTKKDKIIGGFTP
jgi:hypothetical protein